MPDQKEIDGIIRSHTLWAMGAGLIPIPLVDFAAVTAVQLDLLKQLSVKYGINYDESTGKAFVSALTGTTLAALGASLFKAIPVIGTILGGLSLSAFSGASTFAVGQVASAHFAGAGSLDDLDFEAAKEAYQYAFSKGKEVVQDLDENSDKAKDVFESLEKLGRLRDEGVISAADFEAKKTELLARL